MRLSTWHDHEAPTPARRRARRVPRRRSRPEIDRLEGRRLLATTVHEFPIAPQVPFPVGIVQSPANLDFYATETGTGKLAQIDHQTHAVTEIAIPTADSGPFGIAAAPDGTLYFTEALADKIGSYNPTTKAFAEYDIPTPFGFPWSIAVGNDGNVYFTETFNDRIGVLNPKTGHIVDDLPDLQLPSDPKGIVAGPAGDNNLYFVDGSNLIGSLTPTNDASGDLVSAAVSLHLLPGNDPEPFGITIGPDQKVWFTEISAGAIGRWDQTKPAFSVATFDLPSTNSLPLSITPGENGTLSFTDFATNAIGTIDGTTHAITSLPLASSLAGPFSIATDASDGSVWWTESLANEIGKLGSGPLTQIPLPNAQGGPFGMATSTDGKLWFTESASSTLNRIDPYTHAVTSLATPTPDSRPLGIAAGPNGTVAFAEGANKIGVYDPSKSTPITEYDVPTLTGGPLGIALGPNGTFWFTESIAGKIGSLDPATGTFHEYPLADSQSVPSGIVLGPDGNLWFTEVGGGKIGKINPTNGAITEYPVPADFDTPAQIVAGPDGKLWFTQFGVNIGSVDPGTGAMAQYPVLGGFGGSLGLTSGPDGNLYIDQIFGPGVVAFNPTTHATHTYSLPTLFPGSIGMATGPDGNVWLAEYLAGNLGQLQFPMTTTTTLDAGSPNPSTAGQSVEFDAFVANSTIAGAPSPTGTVTFTIDGKDQAPQALVAATGGAAAKLTISTLGVGTHTVTARYNGDANFDPTAVSNQVTQTVHAASNTLSSRTDLRGGTPNPSTVGQSVEFDAFVAADPATEGAPTPTGTVTFTIDGQDQPPQQLVATTGGALAKLTISTLGVGTHTVTARYSGDSHYDPSTASGSASQTVLATPVVAAPQVEGVQRYGYHMGPTQLVVGFSQALDPATAQNLANYQLTVAGLRHPIRLMSATYDPATHTVILRPARLLPLWLRYRLTIIGTPPSGVAGADGQRLDGSGAGRPGTDYTTVITRQNLVVNPARPAVARRAAAHVARHR